MAKKLLLWDVYEITSNDSTLNGVMLRGRIRKLGIEKGFNVLAENTEDLDNSVRFAVLDQDSARMVKDYVKQVIPDATIELRLGSVPNPVISKLKINFETRYNL